MKRKIIVTINADEKTCGKCDRGGWLFGKPSKFAAPWCFEFDKRRPQGDRCAACLAAERKAKGGGK